ncbi:lipocalin-like domain-containing protein [Sphingobacterium suaedae]|uniref:Lipocalin-like domain-containing protein n=2 Tax=Sphingobacterium suaedae TaxID=1686402 RepID=A0ABW5KDE7_9SPHI
MVELNTDSFMTSLKNELVGTWKLLSYIEVPIGGEDSLFPMGKTPFGVLMYSPDGFMSVQISKEERLLYQSNDKMMATQEEMVSSLQGYIAFCGKYKVDNNNAIVNYIIKSSLYPNWKNQVQRRKIDFEGDILYLKSTEPILSNGAYVNSYMTWKRIDRSIDDFFEDNILDEYSVK